MRSWIIVICLLVTSVSSIAQKITVLNVNSKPIPGVTITNGKQFVTTDSLGAARLDGFTDSESLTIFHEKYVVLNISKQEIIEGYGGKVKLRATETMLTPLEVINFNKWELDKDEVPMEFMEFDPADHKLVPTQTAADLLGATGKIFIQKSQLGGGSPMIRGFSANRILIVVDGVRMNNAIFRSGNLQNVIAIDPHTIEEGEVIFGPSSMMYGSDALGGVMDFHSMEPKYFQEDSTALAGNVFTRYASASNERTVHADVNYRRAKTSFLSSVSYSDYGDLRMGSQGPDSYLRPWYVRRIYGKDSIIENSDPRRQVGTGYSQLNTLQKIRFMPMEGWDITYGFHFSETTDIPRYDRLIEERNGEPRYAEWYYGPAKWAMHNFSISHVGEHKMLDRMKTVVAFQNFEESRNDRKFDNPNLRQRTERVKAFNINIDLEKMLKDSSEVFYGAEFVTNRVNSLGWQTNLETSVSEGVAPRYPDNSLWESNAVYVSYKRAIGESASLLVGARYSQVWISTEFDTTFYSFPFDEVRTGMGALSGSLGMAWRLSRLWKFNANLANGFRAPNIDDIAKVFDSEPGAVVVPNTNLKPEYAYTADLGFQYTDREIAQLEVAGFYTILNNAMVREDYTFNGQDSIMYDGQLSKVQAIVNKDQAEIYGVTVAGKYHPIELLTLRGSVTWTEGKTNEGEPVRHVAPLFARGEVKLNKNKFSGSVYVIYNGSLSNDELAPSESSKPHLYAADANGNPYSPSWCTLNTAVSYEVSGLDMVIGVENITDQRYRPYSSGVASPGRNVFASVRYSF